MLSKTFQEGGNKPGLTEKEGPSEVFLYNFGGRRNGAVWKSCPKDVVLIRLNAGKAERPQESSSS